MVLISRKQQIAAWAVHVFTASAAVVGVYTLKAIYEQQYILAFFLMGVAIFIDAIDGTLARKVKTMIAAPRIDGALLDNMVDYINYVITPAFLLLMHPSLLPTGWRNVVISLIVLSSAYQFTQRDAKTDDHFFKGFPSYWNFAVFYLFIFAIPPMINCLILTLLAILVFVPIKYVYPSRMDYLTREPWLRKAMLILSIVYGIANVSILWTYPSLPIWIISFIVFYLVLYFSFSLYRTFVPLERS